MRLPRFAVLLSLLSAIALAGCSGLADQNKPATCPQVKVLKDLGQITRYREGPGRDITDVLLEAQFTRVAGECNVDDDIVELGLIVNMQARQGPALSADATAVNMLVAVTGKDKKVLSRRVMPVRFDFSNNQSTISYLERFLIDIPKTAAQKSEDFTVFMGYELSQEELEFNREGGLL